MFFERSAVQCTRTVGNDEAFTMLHMAYNMNALLISVINRNMYCENEFTKLKGWAARLETQGEAQEDEEEDDEEDVLDFWPPTPGGACSVANTC